MSSNRLMYVYNTRRWRDTRMAVIDMAGGQCTWEEQTAHGWQRCPQMDKRYGGTKSLTVDHTSLHADPYDTRFLRALCRPHHGRKDGGKRIGAMLS